jgi:hypothetical protein
MGYCALLALRPSVSEVKFSHCGPVSGSLYFSFLDSDSGNSRIFFSLNVYIHVLVEMQDRCRRLMW